MGKVIPLYAQQMASIRRDLGDVINKEFADPIEYMGPAFRNGVINMIYATRGLGKTFFVLKLAHAMASGNAFLSWKPKQRAKVMIFDGEMGDESIARRLWMIESSSENSLGFKTVFLVNFADCGGEMWNLSDPKDQALYENESSDCDVVIIDNLLSCSRPISGRDDEFSQWQRIQPFLNRLRGQGKCVVLVHHAGKSALQYGTSQKENAMDYIIGMKPPANNPTSGAFELRWEKRRSLKDSDLPDLFVEMKDDGQGGLSWDYCTLEDKFRQQVLTMHACGTKPREIAEILNCSRSRVAKLISDFSPKETPNGESKRHAVAWDQRVLEADDDSQPF